MADNYAEWKGRMAELDSVIAKMGGKVLVIRKLDGIAEFENKLILNPPRNGEVAPELDDYFDRLSTKLFGITRDDTRFKFPDSFHSLIEGTEEWWQIQSSADQHERHFVTDDSADDEAVSTLLILGVDFRDERGDPLRCTKLFGRQVTAAVMKIAGLLPDADAVELKSLESKLEKEAQLHLARRGKKNGTGASRQDAVSNGHDSSCSLLKDG
ncbi:hypothetical protein [Rhizobium sp. RU35A]|uniref:hypothetical protein n=1 Tax=Rhizobium sp. RU35A TaxID=1907414 RepID=UPI00122C2FB8|nr:hypothetical protein [Rhizobium sp. RU35A]